jgi:membrane protease YdiL (CAAX protease family)
MQINGSSARIEDAQLNQATSSPRFIHRLRELSIVRLLMLGLALASTTIVATIVTRLLVPPAPSPLHQWVLLKNLLLPLLLLAVYARTVCWLERRRASELSLKLGLALFPAGLVVGIAAISGYVLVLLMAGAADVTSGIASGGMLSLGNEFLVPWLTAVGEELLFRAVLFRLTEDMFGTAAAVLISATLFGLSHAANPGANPAALIALALGMGSLLALAFAATRNLWFPIGLHMGWNMAEGFLYGLPNSGLTDPLQLARTSITGQSALTGGNFGPEGSVILVVVCMLISAILLWITLRTHRWTSMRCQLRGLGLSA